MKQVVHATNVANIKLMLVYVPSLLPLQTYFLVPSHGITLFTMDSFENQFIDGIKKIRDLKQRPDVDKIFKTADVQQKIDQMMASF